MTLTSRDVESIIDRRLAKLNTQLQVDGHVSALDPLTVALPTGDVAITYRDPAISLALGDHVYIDHIGDGYLLQGHVAAAGAADAPDHSHTEADITDLATPVIDKIASYTGNNTDHTIVFGGASGTAVAPDGSTFTDDLPTDYSLLQLEGRLEHNDSPTTGITEAQLLFNADTGTDYNYLETIAVGGASAGSGSNATHWRSGNSRVFIDVGTFGTLDLRVPRHVTSSGSLAYLMHQGAVYGFAGVNYKTRFTHGRYEIGVGNPLTEIRIVLTGSARYAPTTRLTLYGLR